MWNPFRYALERRQRLLDAEVAIKESEAAQRREERELYKESLLAITGMAKAAFEASQAQHNSFRSFLDGFRTDTAPVLRDYDEEEDIKAIFRRHEAKRNPQAAQLPQELVGLTYEDQLHKLMEKLDSFELGE